MSKTIKHTKSSDDKPGTTVKASQKNTPPKQPAERPATWIAAPADVVRLAESHGLRAESRSSRVSLWRAGKRVGKVEGTHGQLTYLGKDARKDNTVKIDSMKALEAFIGRCAGIVKDWVEKPKAEKKAKEPKTAPVKQPTKQVAPVKPQVAPTPKPHDPVRNVTVISVSKKPAPAPPKVIGKVKGTTPFSK